WLTGRLPASPLGKASRAVRPHSWCPWSRHKQHLVRRIAWRLQALAQGDLSERARRRALEIANDADLKVRVPSAWVQRSHNSQPDSPRRPDRRLPAPGTLLTRTYRGKTIVVK